MKRLLYSVVIASLLGAAPASRGETFPARSYDERVTRSREERAISTDYLIFQRARERARQRTARLEAYRWMGVSPSRPFVSLSTYSADVNPGLSFRGWQPKPAWQTAW
jgi:hypothetical protein